MTTRNVATLKALGAQAAVAIKSYVARAVEPLATRLAAVETRTGALSMMAGRGGADAGTIAEVERFLARVKALEDVAERIDALERRHDQGDWNEGETYRGGDVVVHQGSVWRCRAVSTRKRPGIGIGWIKSRGSPR